MAQGHQKGSLHMCHISPILAVPWPSLRDHSWLWRPHVLAVLTCPQSAGHAHLRTSSEKFGHLAKSALSTSSAKESIFFLSFLVLKTDLFLEVGILDDLVQCWSNPRIQHLKNSGNEYTLELSAMISFIHWIDHLHLFDPLHCLRVWTGTGTYLGFESYLPTSWKRWRCGNFVKVKLRDLKCLLINHVSILFFTSSCRSPSVALRFQEWSIPVQGVDDESNGARGLSKTFPDVPRMFHVSGRRLWSTFSIPRGLETTAGWLGTWDNFALHIDSTSWNSLTKPFWLKSNLGPSEHCGSLRPRVSQVSFSFPDPSVCNPAFIFLCIPFVLMATDRALEDAVHTTLPGSPASVIFKFWFS